MTVTELQENLHLLVGDGNFKTALPQDISADDFAENVLGFEEVDEVEEEEGDEYLGENGENTYNGGVSGMYMDENEAIPEEND